MKKLIHLSFFSSIFIFAVTGCSPVYKTFYDYEPMKTESQRTCSMSCQMLQQSCSTNQQQNYQLCKSNAQMAYQNCKSNERWGYNSKGKYECQDNCYCYESSCSDPDPSECEAQYASCYRGCGGRVTETTRCVENCEKAGPGPAR